MANLKKISIGGTSYDIVDNGGRLLIGTTAELKTNVKTDLVVAINEVFDAVGTGGTNAVVTVEKSTDGLVYTLKQGGSEIGTINIPKDMVVNGGSYADGNLTLNIANGEPVVIPVADLIVLYTGGKNSEIAVSVGSDNVITATLEDKGITTNKIADEAITTGKIADKNVTEGKLEQDVQDALALARTAYQMPTGGIPASALNDTFRGELTRIGEVTNGYSGTNAISTAIGNAEKNAKDYADGLAGNYATAAQGAKADTAVQEVTGDTDTILVNNNNAQSPSISAKTAEVSETSEALVKGKHVYSYVSGVQTGLQNQLNAIANGVDNNFSAVESRFSTNESNINKALTATKETFVYDASTETLTITSSAV